MTLGSVSVTVGDGALGLSSVLDLPPAVTGCCSSGPIATPTLVASPDDAVATYGQGPMVEIIALLLAKAGGPVVACRSTTATAGFAGGVCQRGAGASSAGTLTAGGGNTSVAAPALSGTPDRPYAVRVLVSTAGANIAAVPFVRISLDGGVTYLAPMTPSVAAAAIGTTGLLLGWTDGSFVLGDAWTAYAASCPTDADATGTTEPTITGAACDSYRVRIQVVRAAASLSALTASVKFSLDDGANYSEEYAVPVSGALVLGNTGLTATFSAGTFVVGDEYRFMCAAPLFNSGGLGAALAALETTEFDHEYVQVVGAVDDVLATTVRTSIEGLAAAGTYRWFLCESRDQVTGETVSTWLSALSGATPGFSAFTSKRGVVAAGYVLTTSEAIGGAQRRSVAWPISARLAQLSKTTDNVGLAEHPGRVRRGAIEGPVALGLVHDGRLIPTLDTRRFIGLQTFQGRTGYYATARTAAPDGSDFTTIMNIRVMCLASRAAQTLLTEYINDNVRTVTGGAIDPRDADAIDAYLTAKLGATLLSPGYVSAVSAAVNRTDNIASTGVLRVKIRVQPLGYATTIDADISFALNLTGN